MDPTFVAQLLVHDAGHGLSKVEIESIADQAEVLEIPAGYVVHAVGQQLDAVYIVVSGRLKLLSKASDGVDRIVHYISAGDQFGTLILVSDDDEFPIEAVADQKTTLLRWPKETAKRLAEDFPRFRQNLMRRIGFDVRDSLRARDTVALCRKL